MMLDSTAVWIATAMKFHQKRDLPSLVSDKKMTTLSAASRRHLAA